MLIPKISKNKTSHPFNSLSYRGQKGYSANFLTNKSSHLQLKRNTYTYGAILCIKSDKQDQDKYALVQGRYTKKWSFPKGHSNEGEEPIECTLREVKEETGIETLPEPIAYLNIGFGNYFVFYLESEHQLVPRDKHEIINAKWVSIKEMEEMELNADANLFRRLLTI